MDIPPYSDAALSLINNNHKPEPWEEALAYAEIERGEKICHAIDEETVQLLKQIDELQHQVKRLLEKRPLVVKFVDDHKAILSPLRRHRLPPEVLAQIFHYTAPVVAFDQKMDGYTDIWSLGRVCSEWRTALLSFGSLWSVLEIKIDHVNFRCAPLLKEALSRSKDGLLDIFLHPLLTTSAINKHLHDILHALTAVSHRWRAIQILNIPEEQFSLLSVVEVRFVEAPSLREVSISIFNATISPATFQLPWSQLRRCRIKDAGFWTPQHELNVLRVCPNLEIHSLCTFESDSNLSSSDVVYLHKLHTLSLELGIGITLVDNLILPSLNSVILRSRSAYVEQDIETVARLESLISRSSAHITTMEMNRINNPRLFLDVLKLDDLTTLRVDIVNHDDILLQILTIKPEDSRVILPRLEVLHLRPYYRDGAKLNLKPLVQMVQSRWHIPDEHSKTISRLAFLEYKPYGVSELLVLTTGTLAPLLVFRDEGLKLGPKLALRLESDCDFIQKREKRGKKSYTEHK